MTASDTVLVVIEPVNDAPVINLPTSLVSIEFINESIDLTDYITDVDGDSLTLDVEGNDYIDEILIDGFVITFVDDTYDVNENILFTITDGLLIGFDAVNVTLLPDGPPIDPNSIVITLPNLDGLEPGEEFELPVDVNILLEVWEIYGFEFWLYFDDSVLEFLGWNFEDTIGDTTRVVHRDGAQFVIQDFDEPIFGAGSLINIEFKYISYEYEQDVVELDEFEFHSPGGPIFPIVLDGVINNDYPTLAIPINDTQLDEDFGLYSLDLDNFFFDNTPQSDLEFSVISSSQDFAVTIDNNIMNIVSIPDKFTTQLWPVSVICYDRFLYSVRDTFTVMIDPINDPPVITISQDFEIATDGQLHIDFADFITDVDNLLRLSS